VRALVARYPALALLPRADLGVVATPVERWTVDGTVLHIKRDDLSAVALGGNKVRALELLLGGLAAGSRVLTVGATGSTHALAVAVHGASLGLRPEVLTWPQEGHDVAGATADRMAALARVTRTRSVAEAYLRALVRRARGTVRWIPAGGSVALGALGQVAAALELAEQLDAGAAPVPGTLVVPLGSGGTAAGLLAGLALAGLPTRVVGVQVVPRLVAGRGRVLALARRTLALVARHAGSAVPMIDGSRFSIDRGAYGGAYGRTTPAARVAAALLARAGGPRLDPTYSAKAFVVALERARGAPDEPVLFWLTFDGRWLG
jgi:D-cysteine desulfhydrase